MITCPKCNKSDGIACHRDVVAVSQVVGKNGDEVLLHPETKYFGGDNHRFNCECGTEFIVPKGTLFVEAGQTADELTDVSN